MASSLTKLLRKGVKFEWDDKCQSNFERLKAILVEAPVLIQPTRVWIILCRVMLRG